MAGKDRLDDHELDEVARLMMAWMGLSMKLQRGNEGLKLIAGTGLTMQQIVALHILQFTPDVSVSELTERLDLSTSATSHLVQRLVEQGFVVREEDPTDRRQKRLSMTADGSKLVRRLMSSRLKELRTSVQHLSAPVLLDLKDVLVRVIEELQPIAARPATPGKSGTEEHDPASKPSKGPNGFLEES